MAKKQQPKKALGKKRGPAKARKAAPPAAGKRVDTDAAVKWYRERRPLYQSLCEKVAGIVEEVLKAEGAEYHSVDYRAKDLDSFEKKAEGYQDATAEIYDMAGVRVIAYVESEARRIASIVRDLFEIDRAHSEDKSIELGVDKMGYRSVHYVASLPANRCKLPEFKKFSGMRFEVQVRTILQHAWAEIEHDRNYKFTGVLPPEIQRRFAVLAGSLELLDGEFDRIAAEIDEYAGRVVERTSAGELDIPVDTISLRQYLIEKFASAVNSGGLEPRFAGGDESARELSEELEGFGIRTLADLDRLIPEGFEEAVSRIYSAHHGGSFLGLVRQLLIIANAERFFTRSWQERWQGIEPRAEELLREFGVDVDKLAMEYDLDVYGDAQKPAG